MHLCQLCLQERRSLPVWKMFAKIVKKRQIIVASQSQTPGYPRAPAEIVHGVEVGFVCARPRVRERARILLLHHGILSYCRWPNSSAINTATPVLRTIHLLTQYQNKTSKMCIGHQLKFIYNLTIQHQKKGGYEGMRNESVKTVTTHKFHVYRTTHHHYYL